MILPGNIIKPRRRMMVAMYSHEKASNINVTVGFVTNVALVVSINNSLEALVITPQGRVGWIWSKTVRVIS